MVVEAISGVDMSKFAVPAVRFGAQIPTIAPEVSPILSSELDIAKPSNLEHRHFHASPREHEILVNIANGKTSASTANTLGIAKRTTEFHRENIAIKNRPNLDNSHEKATTLIMCQVINEVLDGTIEVEKIPQEINLTNREAEITGLILNGYSTSEISKELFIENKTIEARKYKLYSQLGAKKQNSFCSNYRSIHKNQ